VVCGGRSGSLNRQVRGSSPWRRTREDRSLGPVLGVSGSGSSRARLQPGCRAAYRLPIDARGSVRSVGASDWSAVTATGRVRARRGTGSITLRGGRIQAQVSLGVDAGGRRIRHSKTFDTRAQAEAWLATQHAEHAQLTDPVTDDRLADYLRWWLAAEAPKGKPGRRPLARTTLANYRVVIEHHLIPALGHRKVGALSVGELDDFASRKLAAGYAPGTVNRMRETLRSALSTAVRQDRLIRNVARYGGGVAAARPPVHRFTDHELALILKAARHEHFFPIILLLARTGLRPGEACGLRWRDLDLGSAPPHLTVVWQLDRWGELVHPKTATSRRTIPLRTEVAAELEAWRHRQQQRATDAFDNAHGLAFTTRSGRPIDQRNLSRAFHRVRTSAGVDHGSLKTFRSTVATQLAEAGLHPSKTQAFLGHDPRDAAAGRRPTRHRKPRPRCAPARGAPPPQRSTRPAVDRGQTTSARARAQACGSAGTTPAA
jgi:integrase